MRPALLGLPLSLLGCMGPGRLEPGASPPEGPAAYEPAAPETRIVLVSPRGGEVLSGTVELRAAVAGDADVTVLSLFVGEGSVATLRAAPFVEDLDTTSLPDGVVHVAAVVRFADGTTEEARVAARVDNHPPAIEVLEPADGSYRFVEDEPFRFAVRAHDGLGLARVVLRAGDVVLADLAPVLREDLAVSVEAASLYPAGAAGTVPVALSAEITDELGRVATSSVQVRVRSRLAWRFDTLGRIETPPLPLPDGGVVVGSFDGRLYVLGADGTERCRVDTGEEVVGAPALTPDGATVVWGTTRRLRAADAATCAARWTHGVEGVWRAGPTIAPDGTIYAAEFGGTLYAFSPNGATRWTFPLGGEAIAAPAVAPDGTVLAGSFSGFLVAVGVDGTERWRFETGDEIGAPPLATDDAIYVGSYDFYLYALGHDGAEIWEYPFATDADVQCAPSVLPRGDVAFCSRDGFVYAVESEDGTEKWSFETPGITYGGTSVGADGTVYAGGADGTLFAVGTDGRLRWSFETFEAIVARPAPAGGMVFVAGADRRLYALWADGTPAE